LMLAGEQCKPWTLSPLLMGDGVGQWPTEGKEGIWRERASDIPSGSSLTDPNDPLRILSDREWVEVDEVRDAGEASLD
jgi:hypothetical protein